MKRTVLWGVLACALPWMGAQALAADPSLASLKSNKVVIQDVQAALAAQGYDKSKPTGVLNPKTSAAFVKFVTDKGLADKPIEAQLLALGIDLSTLANLKLSTEGKVLVVDNGLKSNIGKRSFLYNWQSFEVGRYRVVDGEELFKLDLAYCENFDRGPGGDCDSGRHRVQFMDDSQTRDPHVLYAFEFLPENLPPAAAKHIQFAELNQMGGFSVKHYETGANQTSTPRFTLELQDGNYTIQDNALIDVSLIGGSLIKPASVPAEPGKWVKVEVEVKWSPEGDGLFRYWLNGKPLWERTGRNSSCRPGPKCNLFFKYGPYTGHLDPGAPDLKDNPVAFRYRGLTKLVGDKDIAAYLASHDTNFVTHTERTGGPSKPARILTTAQIENNDNPSKVNVLLSAEITDAKPGQNLVEFNVQAKFVGDSMFDLTLVLDPPLGPTAPAALAKCGQRPTDEWDGQHHAVLRFQVTGTDYVAQDYDCRVNAVPPKVAWMMKFLVTSFKELAADMVTSGNIQTIQNQSLRNWLTQVAEGTVTLRAPS
jgi:hypothetical protein